MTEHIHNMSDDLLVKHLTGEAGEGEMAMVDVWLQQDEANRRYYDGFIQIWEQSLQLGAGVTADEEAAWQQLKKRIEGVAEPVAPVKEIRAHFNYKKALGIAAAVLLVAACGIIGYIVTGLFTGKPVTQMAVNTKTNIIVDTLNDGSVVTINRHSGIVFPSVFKGNTREVKLDGEAFFNISPNKSKPFIIHTNDVTITVVGTSFNVRTVNGKTEVIVETGVVTVSNGKKTVQLKPKEKVFADSIEVYGKDTAADKLYTYYRSREFVCDNTPLKRLVEVLNEAYDDHISIENKAIENLPITTVFKEESLERILAVVSQTLDITVQKNNDTYILR